MSPAAESLCTSVRVSGLPGRHSVRLPARQPGASALVGYLRVSGDRYVLKALKVADLRATPWWRALDEPAYVQLLRRMPFADSPFAPTRAMRVRVEGFHAVCRPWLRDIRPQRAAELLRAALPSLPLGQVNALVDELFAVSSVLQLMPLVSRLVEVDFVEAGVAAVPALLQEDLRGSHRDPRYRLRLSRFARHEPAQRRRHIAFLVLLAAALGLARHHRMGLDLSVRYAGDGALRFPNVLHGPADSPDLAYIDFFGLATPDGNLVERAGHALAYGSHGVAAPLARKLARRLTETGVPV